MRFASSNRAAQILYFPSVKCVQLLLSPYSFSPFASSDKFYEVQIFSPCSPWGKYSKSYFNSGIFLDILISCLSRKVTSSSSFHHDRCSLRLHLPFSSTSLCHLLLLLQFSYPFFHILEYNRSPICSSFSSSFLFINNHRHFLQIFSCRLSKYVSQVSGFPFDN